MMHFGEELTMKCLPMSPCVDVQSAVAWSCASAIDSVLKQSPQYSRRIDLI